MSAGPAPSETSETWTSTGEFARPRIPKRRLPEEDEDTQLVDRLMPRLEGEMSAIAARHFFERSMDEESGTVPFHPALLAGSVAHSGLWMSLCGGVGHEYMRQRIERILPMQLDEDALVLLSFGIMVPQPRMQLTCFSAVASQPTHYTAAGRRRVPLQACRIGPCRRGCRSSGVRQREILPRPGRILAHRLLARSHR